MTAPVTITLPWPSPKLSPNARVHWAVLHKAKRDARADAGVLALTSGAKGLRGSAGLVCAMTFHPPANWRFDDDGLVSRMKAARDGIADICGVDDFNWTMAAPVIAEPRPPHGAVVVTLSPIVRDAAA